MRDLRLRIVIKSAVAAFLAVAAYVAVYRIFGFGIRCPLRALTGLLCPLCGMTHALEAVLRGHFELAMRYNALSLTLVPVGLVWLLYRAVRYVRTGDDSFHTGEKVMIGISLIICLVYFAVRNHLI